MENTDYESLTAKRERLKVYIAVAVHNLEEFLGDDFNKFENCLVALNSFCKQLRQTDELISNFKNK